MSLIKDCVICYGTSSDAIAAQTVIELEKEYPKIKLILVLPSICDQLAAKVFNNTNTND